MNSATMLKTLGWRLILISVMAVLAVQTGRAAAAGEAGDPQMLAAARSFVKANSVPGLTFDLKVLKQVNDFVLLRVTPNGKWVDKTDPAAMILNKAEGKWTVMFFGTDATPWKQMVPDLFK
jgi:hypothetical protein